MSFPAVMATPWRIYRGDDSLPLRITLTDAAEPLDLTGWGGWRAQWRRRVRDSHYVDLTVTVTDPSAGLVEVSVSAAQSRGINSSGVWDLQATTPDGLRRTLVRGQIEWEWDVTRDD